MSNAPAFTPPIYNNQIVAQGLARLTSSFITQPNVRAILAVYLQPWQDLEDATWGVLTGRFLATATVYSPTAPSGPTSNVVFDILGALIGQARGGLSDADLKALIYLRVAVNRATGRETDWSRFAQILAPFCDDTPVYYGDAAGIYFGCWNIFPLASPNPANSVAQALARAVPNGVAAELAYSTWEDGNDLEFTSIYGGASGQGGWGSVYAPTVGGLLVAAAELQ